jgi:molybdopterin molybdotransferase
MSFDDCFLHDRDRLRHDDALALLKERVPIIANTENISTGDALCHILAEDITAPQDVPLHTNAAVDGYAYMAPADGPLKVSGRIAAGDLAAPPLETGTAVRVFTGAAMPEGADTVAMQEDCTEDGDTVMLPPLKAGANCRKRGEDVRAGDAILPAGQRLRPQDLAALASIGATQVKTFTPLSATILSNGAELRLPGSTDTLQPGEVFDANAPLLTALMATMPVKTTNPPIIPDTAEAVHTAITEAATHSDIIITTAGASRGDEDYMRAALSALGHCHLWQLAVKPGRPMMFGQIPRAGKADCFFFGLPGNPVAATVCFLLYVRPALLSLAGAEWSDPPRFMVPAAFSVAVKKPDRREFARGTYRDGKAHRFPRDGSGLISSLVSSNGLIELPEEVTTIQKGDPVAFIPYSAFD